MQLPPLAVTVGVCCWLYDVPDCAHFLALFAPYLHVDGQDGNDLCAEQPDQFPNDLIQLPSNQDPRNRNPTIPPNTPSAASAVQPWSLAVFLLSSLFFLLH